MSKFLGSLGKKKVILITLGVLLVIVCVVVSVFVFSDRDKTVKDKKCIVEFDSNGGSSLEKQEIICGSSIKVPNVKPEKFGFEFVNWTYNNLEFDFNKTINENIVLVANYNKVTDEPIVEITFDSAGGSEVKKIELVKGTTINEPVSPVKQGYTFEGWYLEETKFDFTQVINDNITLIAKWSVKISNKVENNSNQNNKNDSKPSENIPIKVPENSKDIKALQEKLLKMSNQSQGYWYLEDTIDVIINFTPFSNSPISMIFEKISSDLNVIPNDSGYEYTYEELSFSSFEEMLKTYNITILSSNKIVMTKGSKSVILYNQPERNVKKVEYNNQVDLELFPNESNKHDIVIKMFPNYVIDDIDLSRIATSSNNNVLLIEDINNGGRYREYSEIRLTVKALKIGKSTLTVKLKDKVAKINVTVSPVKAQSINISETNVVMITGDTKNLTYSISPSSASGNSVHWSSSNNSVASVSNDGKIVANSSGTCTITVSVDGVKASSTITVIDPVYVNSINLSETKVTLTKGNGKRLSYTINPSNATNKDLTWTSSDNSVVSVDQNGNIKANSKGKAIISVKASTGSEASCEVDVVNPPLEADVKEGITQACDNLGCGKYVFVEIVASGGSGRYSYNYSVYKDGVYIGSSTKVKSYFPPKSGTYRIEYTVTDSDGVTFKGTSSAKISIN